MESKFQLEHEEEYYVDHQHDMAPMDPRNFPVFLRLLYELSGKKLSAEQEATLSRRLASAWKVYGKLLLEDGYTDCWFKCNANYHYLSDPDLERQRRCDESAWNNVDYFYTKEYPFVVREDRRDSDDVISRKVKFNF